MNSSPPTKPNDSAQLSPGDDEVLGEVRAARRKLRSQAGPELADWFALIRAHEATAGIRPVAGPTNH